MADNFSFKQLEHLLPRGDAWGAVLAGRLREYVRALSTVGGDFREFLVDNVFNVIDPRLTKFPDLWEEQFGLFPSPLEETQRRNIATAWAASGGQGPYYLQKLLNDAGFDVILTGPWVTEGGAPYTVAGAGEIGNVTLPDAGASGATMNPAGDRLYQLIAGTDTIEQYDYPIGWRLTSSVPVPAGSGTLLGGATPQGLAIQPDGERILYGSQDANPIARFIGSVALDIPFDAASLDTGNFDQFFPTEPATIQSIAIGKAGARAYVVDGENVWQYNFGIPWSVTSLGYSGQLFNKPGGDLGAVQFSDDGGFMFLVDNTGGIVLEKYELAIPWEVGSAQPVSESVVIGGSSPDPTYLIITGGSFPGGRMWFNSFASAALYEYRTGAPEARDPGQYVGNGFVGATQSGDTEAECGEPQALCGNEILATQGYIVNLDLSDRAQPPLSSNPDTWGDWLYVSADAFPTAAVIAEERRAEFEQLMLTTFPAENWIGTLVTYVPQLPPVSAEFELIAFYSAGAGLTTADGQFGTPGENVLALEDLTVHNNNTGQFDPAKQPGPYLTNWHNQQAAIQGAAGTFLQAPARPTGGEPSPIGMYFVVGTPAVAGVILGGTTTSPVTITWNADESITIDAGVPLTTAPGSVPANDEVIVRANFNGPISEIRTFPNSTQVDTYTAGDAGTNALQNIYLMGRDDTDQTPDSFEGEFAVGLIYNRLLTTEEDDETFVFLIDWLGLTGPVIANINPDLIFATPEGFLIVEDPTGFILVQE